MQQKRKHLSGAQTSLKLLTQTGTGGNPIMLETKTASISGRKNYPSGTTANVDRNDQAKDQILLYAKNFKLFYF